MERTLKDEDTGISIRGTKLYQAELEVTEESDADELQKLQQALAKDDLKIARVQAYTLNVTKNGQAMTPETDYYLYLPVDMDSLTDSQDYALYYQDEQGALTEVSFMIMGGQAAAVVRDFGTYVLAVTEQEEDDKPVPSDPESDPGSNPESDPGSNPESETGSESPAPETGAALPTAAVLLSLLAAGTIVVTKRKK